MKKGDTVKVFMLETGIQAQIGKLIKKTDDQEWLVELKSGRRVYLSENALWGIECY